MDTFGTKETELKCKIDRLEKELSEAYEKIDYYETELNNIQIKFLDIINVTRHGVDLIEDIMSSDEDVE